MLALAVDETGRGPAAVIGLGADLDPRVALIKAVFELGQGVAGETARFLARGEDARIRDVSQVKAIMDHSTLFNEPEYLRELDFLRTGTETRRLDAWPTRSSDDPARDLAHLVDLLRRAGSRAAFVDVTTSDVADTGLVVVRTVATELQPIHFGYRCERFGGRRVLDAPARMGLATVDDHEDLNRCPHPLP